MHLLKNCKIRLTVCSLVRNRASLEGCAQGQHETNLNPSNASSIVKGLGFRVQAAILIYGFRFKV